MKTLNSTYKRVQQWFLEDKNIEHIHTDEVKHYTLFESKGVNIKITDHTYENGDFSAKLLMETKETFFSWDNAYYISKLPVTKQDFLEAIKNIPVLLQEEHINRADNFYKFFS